MEMGSVEGTIQSSTMPQTLEILTNWEHILPLTHKPRWKSGIPNSRKGNLILGLSQNLGVSRTLNFRGRRELLTTRCILLKAKWRVLSETVLDGWNVNANMSFMAGGDPFGFDYGESCLSFSNPFKCFLVSIGDFFFSVLVTRNLEN